MAFLKLTKSEAGYQFHPDVEYTCSDCVMHKDLPKGGGGCAWFGPSDPISLESGSCNYFAHAHDRKPELPWLALFTPVQLGYLENRQGFSCKRCVHIDLRQEDCERVEKDSNGDTPGEIDPMGCCNLWKPDRKRAALATPKLLDLIASLQKSAGKMAPDEYRRLREAGEL